MSRRMTAQAEQKGRSRVGSDHGAQGQAMSWRSRTDKRGRRFDREDVHVICWDLST